jgi:hypothetical protein
MPVHGGYVERFTACGVPDSGFLRWFDRGGATIVEPRCNSQVPLSGPTKVARACKCVPDLERKSEGGSPGRGLPLSAYISCHCIWTDPPRLWVRRALEAYANLGITNGWMFRNKKGEAERMGFYEPYMFELIQRVQDAGTVTERLLLRDDDNTVSHGIARSERRGYATHATHVGISDADIKRLARWRAIEAVAGRAASLPGGDNEGYSEINQMIKSLLIASRPL